LKDQVMENGGEGEKNLHPIWDVREKGGLIVGGWIKASD